jgi:hypothetical protein
MIPARLDRQVHSVRDAGIPGESKPVAITAA